MAKLINLFEGMRKLVFYKRSLVLYLGVIVVLNTSINYDKVRSCRVNELKIPLNYLFDFTQGKVPYDSERFKEYIAYFESIDKIVPNTPEVNGLLAFCYYYQNQSSKAIGLYRKALEVNPRFFWLQYDLGLIYFKAKDFKLAAKYFINAVKLSPKVTLGITKTCPVFLDFERPLIKDGKPVSIYDYEVINQQSSRLSQAYDNALGFLVLSYYMENNFAEMFRLSIELTSSGQNRNRDRFLFYGGVAAYHLGLKDQAVIFLKDYLDKDPQSPEALYYFVRSLASVQSHEVSAELMKTSESSADYMKRHVASVIKESKLLFM